ncbi:MAG: formylglycine-generating enzyme family protein, partial [Treponema sp.]|nr:formylglycine-generating enzyme family protein [Treponema sp.]
AHPNWNFVPVNTNLDWNSVTCDFSKNGYRLPTEAEWEYAARGGEFSTSEAVWSGTNSSSDLVKYAWFQNNSFETHEVKKLLPNAYGLYDMSGNAWEWCWDWAGDYSSDDVVDPTGAQNGTMRISRGGAAGFHDIHCTSHYRGSNDPYRMERDGIRVVRSAPLL